MENGIYHVKFRSSDGGDGVGSGLVVVRNGSLNGGDFGYIYWGQEVTTGNNIKSKVHISRYDASQQSLFGDLKNFDLELDGTLNNSGKEFNLSGTVIGHPQLEISVAGKKLRDLAPVIGWI